MVRTSRIQNRPQAYAGLAIMAVSIASLFWWGFHFQIFDTDIDWVGHPIRYGGFFAWMVVGIFGAGYAYGGIRGGLRAAGYVFAFFVFAAAIGALRRSTG